MWKVDVWRSITPCRPKVEREIRLVLQESTAEGPYAGYHKAGIPVEDAELTHTGPGTPMGELLRKFWQPVCLAEELTELPKAIRIMGEDLVAFRDRSGRVGVLRRHCSHRGTSLEYGIVSERGIRCCYHGWLFDVDGAILETPGEPPDSKLRETIRHGAYPAHEYEGLVFAYLGPPADVPPFPIFDCYIEPAGNRLIPFSIWHPCNWLQVHDNVMDPVHAAFLHTQMSNVQLTESYGAVPVLDFADVPNGMVYIASRRIDDRVWIKGNHMMLPNVGQTTALWETADEVKYFSGVSLTKWIVPADDANCWMFGYRHFNEEVDPDDIGREDECGVDKIDFFAQTGHRSYEEMQREPGDWDAQVSQRPIAIHALEHLGSTDQGVSTLRRLLRQSVRAERDPLADLKAQCTLPEAVHTYCYDTVLRIPPRPDTDDRDFLRRLGRDVVSALMDADAYDGEERRSYLCRRMQEIEATY